MPSPDFFLYGLASIYYMYLACYKQTFAEVISLWFFNNDIITTVTISHNLHFDDQIAFIIIFFFQKFDTVDYNAKIQLVFNVYININRKQSLVQFPYGFHITRQLWVGVFTYQQTCQRLKKQYLYFIQSKFL